MEAKKDLLNFDDKQRNYLFNLAVKKLKSGDNKRAADTFQLLVAMEPTNALYVKSLAGSKQAQQDYLNAYLFYTYAYNLEEKPAPDYLFFIGLCLYHINEMVKAEENLRKYLDSGDRQFSEKANTLLKLIALEHPAVSAEVSGK